MSLPAQHGPQERAESQDLLKGPQGHLAPGLSPLPSPGLLGQDCTEAQPGTGMRRQASGRLQCHKEALVPGYPDSPALDEGCLSKAHIKV